MHIPVLQKEVLKYLDPKPNQNFIDCTVGEAGHTLAILEKNGPKGRVLGIDIDPEIITQAQLKFQKCSEAAGWEAERLKLVCDSFSNLAEIAKKQNFKQVSGILFDLGLSSWHLEESGRGFSFLRDEPLIMRYDWNPAESIVLRSKELSAQLLTAEKIVNQWPEKEIEKILKKYGEERFARAIARKITQERKLKPIKTTFQLVEIIRKAVPGWYQHKKIHFATRTFQALRIAVNDELNNLEKALPQALEILKPGGRMVIISFQSLEDRIVKNFFRNYTAPTRAKLEILTKKPIRPSKQEIKINPRSRSAKLRAVQKIEIGKS